jgi:diguanylate cyclase (GGDEF)-like protein
VSEGLALDSAAASLNAQEQRIARLRDSVDAAQSRVTIARLRGASAATRLELKQVVPMFERAASRGQTTELQRLQRTIVDLRAELEARDRQIRELLEQTNRDGLTGCLDRRGFDATMAREWARATRAEVPLGLLFIDVDNFKRVNDGFGHPAGDAALRAIADSIEAQARRSGEFVARYGGDEFVCIVPGTDLAGTLTLGERVRVSVSELRIQMPTTDTGESRALPLSVSIGGSSIVPEFGMESSRLIELADRAVYVAKEQGRDRTVGFIDDGAFYAPKAPSAPVVAVDPPSVVPINARRGR